MTRVLVIGGGIAGLTAAGYLAKARLKPILLEASDEVGGYFGSFEAGGYVFEKGLRAVENSGTLFPMLRGLGLEGAIDFVPNPVSLSIGGRVLPMRDARDIAGYFEALKEIFPAEVPAIDAIGADALAVCSRLDAMYGRDNPAFARSPLEKLASIPWTMRNLPLFLELRGGKSFLSRELVDYLGSKTKDEELVRVLSDPFFEGTPTFFGLGYSRLFQDYHYPMGGMRSIPAAMRRRIEELGGRVETGKRVAAIEVESGRARRAICSDGSRYEAEAFVYAGDMRRLYLELLKPEDAPDELRSRIAKDKAGKSAFTAYLGVDLPPESFAASGGAHVIHVAGPGAGRASGPDPVSRIAISSIEASIPCLRDPSLAPPGKTGLILSFAARPEDFGLDGRAARGEAYADLKRRAARAMIAAAESIYPGLSGKVELMLTASPLTMERHTLNAGGALNGWAADRDAAPVSSDFLSFMDVARTPVVNLMQAGHWLFSPAGAPVAMMTGKLAADLALKGA